MHRTQKMALLVVRACILEQDLRLGLRNSDACSAIAHGQEYSDIVLEPL